MGIVVCATSTPPATTGRGLPPEVNRNCGHRSVRHLSVVWAPHLYVVLNKPTPRQRKIITQPLSATHSGHHTVLLVGAVFPPEVNRNSVALAPGHMYS